MKLAVTGKTQAPERAPLVFRGPYEEMIPAAARLGYDAMELHIHDSAQLNRADLKKLFTDNGITLTSIGTGSAYAEDHIHLASADESVRQRAIRRIQDHMDTAANYDAVVILGLIKGMIRDCPSRESCIDRLTASLKELVKKAEADKVPLVFEVLNRYESDFLNTIDETLTFVAPFASDYLQLHIDTYHMNIEEAKVGDAIRRAKGKIGHCHIADSDRWYAGHGHFDFGETIQALKDIGYSRALSVESFMFPDSLTSAAESLKTLKKFV